jgi:hypothetical protein
MEAAALYAFADVCSRPVLCFAHATKEMSQPDGDFEKGVANEAPNLLTATARARQAGRGR